MKRLVVGSAAILLFIGLCGLGYAAKSDANKPPKPPRKKMRLHRRPPRRAGQPAANLRDANKPHHKMAPGQMMLRRARLRIRQLQQIKKIATKESATKTVAALDKLIASEKKVLSRLNKAISQRRPGKAGPPAGGRGQKQPKGRHRQRGQQEKSTKKPTRQGGR